MVAVRITRRARGSQLDRPASHQSPAACWLPHGGRRPRLCELHAVLCKWGPGDPAGHCREGAVDQLAAFGWCWFPSPLLSTQPFKFPVMLDLQAPGVG